MAHARTKKISAVIVSLVLMAPTAAIASGFYERYSEGWFWYQDPEPEEEVEPEPEEEPEDPPVEMMEMPEVDEQPDPGPRSFTVEWFQENAEQVLNRAIDNPTEENVAAYYYLQRVMVDRSEQFAHVAREVARRYPELDERSRRSGGRATMAMDRRHREEVVETLSERLGQLEAGIWFFFDGGIYSERTALAANHLSNSTGLPIYAFSHEGAELSGRAAGLFPEARLDEGQSEFAGVRTFPAVALAIPPNEIELVAHGNAGSAELERRTVAAATQMGILTEEENAIYRGVRPEYDQFDEDRLPEIEGLDTDVLLEAMNETYR